MNNQFDIGIVGAGMAGLALSILMSKKGYKVILFEKSKFPFHKLCGEYLSKESIPFLESLGVDFNVLAPADINRLEVTHPSGKSIEQTLPLGGIGISRYRLDNVLKLLAESNNVYVCENTLVKEVKHIDNQYVISTNNGIFKTRLSVLSYGKKSNLKRLNGSKSITSNQYLGVKYHVRNESFSSDLIQMNTFENGYCGVCRVEDEWVSLCYLTGIENLNHVGNNIRKLEEEVLFKNRVIRQIFEESQFVYEKPITVSNIDFYKKPLEKDGLIFCGDAAGLITPLAGNGMSIALHSAKILSEFMDDFLSEKISKQKLIESYLSQWNRNFNLRMKSGRQIQKLFKNQNVANLALSILGQFPVISRRMISLTHGQPF